MKLRFVSFKRALKEMNATYHDDPIWFAIVDLKADTEMWRALGYVRVTMWEDGLNDLVKVEVQSRHGAVKSRMLSIHTSEMDWKTTVAFLLGVAVYTQR